MYKKGSLKIKYKHLKTILQMDKSTKTVAVTEIKAMSVDMISLLEIIVADQPEVVRKFQNVLHTFFFFFPLFFWQFNSCIQKTQAQLYMCCRMKMGKRLEEMGRTWTDHLMHKVGRLHNPLGSLDNTLAFNSLYIHYIKVQISENMDRPTVLVSLI